MFKKLFALYLKIKHWLLRCTRDRWLIRKFAREQRRNVERMKGKERLKCVFFVLNDTVWKYDYVFRRMMESERFDPVVLVCPHAGYGFDYMKEMMERTEDFFTRVKQYPVVTSYDFRTGQYVDVRERLQPDIIFFCVPYAYNVDKRYYITRYPDVLTVYVPYTFNNSTDYKAFYDELLHNLVWRYYAETEEHRNYSVRYARNRGVNVVVTGYPGIEMYLDKGYKTSTDAWKLQDSSLKKIIWAPHWSVEKVGTVIFSCFLQYCDFMLEMARKYSDRVQFILKPHPLLRVKLNGIWGKERTDAYFDEWSRLPNAAYTEGNYVDIFKTSDAMIHDSGSFIAEYLYLNKPVMRTMNGYPVEQMYNSFTVRCIDRHYKAFSEKDIENFILMVIEGRDPMLEERTDFIAKELLPKGMPSQNIIDDILSSIDA